MKILLATHNLNKYNEILHLVPKHIELVHLTMLGIHDEIPETGTTLTENALIKARFLASQYNIPVIADDTGLEVKSLNNEPGVYSARYAGNQKNSDDNMNLLLDKLSHFDNREAQFVTVIALIYNENEFTFEGVCKGQIIEEKRGNAGFGYDPIFMPEGHNITFAMMNMDQKSKLSHRGKAIQNLINHLNNNIN